MYILCTVEIDKGDKVFTINTEKSIPKFMFLRPSRFFFGTSDSQSILIVRNKKVIDLITVYAFSWIDGLYTIQPEVADRIKGELELIRAGWFDVGDALCVNTLPEYEEFLRKNYWFKSY